ncbi:MAG: DUF3769 domain-containing protein [Cyanobacteria bacterium P01_D01_bin.36]
MVHINLPPEPPAAIVLSATSLQETAQTSHPKDQLDRLLASQTSPQPSLAQPLLTRPDQPTLQPSVASLLTQQAETELPVLSPSTDSATTPVDNEPAIVDRQAEPVDAPQAEPLEEQPNRIELEDLRGPEAFASQLRLNADRQTFDPTSQTVTASGNVVLQLNDAIIETDELWVNLTNRYALAEGDVLLTRGAQIVRGRRLEYNFIQQAGIVGDAVGTLYLPAVEEDFSSPTVGISSSRRAYDPVGRNPDLQVGNDGNLLYGTRLSTQPINNSALDGDLEERDRNSERDNLINQLRFETEELAFDVDGWRADEVRITNDPFSPPEIELRADGLLLRSISATQDELLLQRPRLVFDQGLAVPLLRSRILLNRGSVNPEDINPVPAPVGIDSSDRGGFFIGRQIPLVTTERTRLNVTPQFFIARALSGENGSPVSDENFGVTADLQSQLSPRTALRGNVALTSFNLPEITENLRASLIAEQAIGDHRLSLQYSYRERLFNGSLGFQDVQSIVGALLLSPTYTLGDTGLRLTYQVGAQLINAESDRDSLLEARDSDTGRITAGRYQGSVALRHTLNLWRGEPKPLTQEQGLRFTAQPVVPYLDLKTGVRTVLTSYSTGDAQNSLIADIDIEAQLGHFARNFGDYTRLNLAYSQSFIGEASSPFLFDREVDRNVLTLGIVQQVYGPFLAGYQTAYSFSEDRAINNIYSLEYSRRTYGILLRYDSVQETGSIGFRLSNFRWIGDTDPFDTPRIRRVQGGVIEAR